ncbi:MAG: type I secretion system permease/ATPase [Paracoccaceae bacterium]|nr:type I secretion system permease/ATPase [Paracoccaceae bacterium]MDG2258088.1 type I secretion system permease/ATPase [Paracoccaceae bacterium]
MRPSELERGREELIAARRESRPLYWFVGVFSFFTNLLMLTGPIYMLQVYDRVLGSRSEATLLALTILVAFLYGTMGILDYTRGRVMARVGARFQDRLDRRVFEAALKMSSPQSPQNVAATAQRDLEGVQRLMISPALMSVFDIPWTPVFLAGIALFHPWLGILALSGGTVLILITVLNQILTKRPIMRSSIASFRSDSISDQLRSESEMVQSLGMRGAAFERWQKARAEALQETINSSDLAGTFSTTTKTLRMFLQSAMLGLGAYLVLQNELTPGAMIAGSILMGRALSPIEQAIGQWAVVQRGTKGWSNLVELLSTVPEGAPRTQLPTPKAKLDVQALTVIPPGQQQATLKNVVFNVQAGQAVGVIGPSGSGKTTLARAITGVWRPAGGKIRLDGAALDQYEPDTLGTHVGYLPQRVQLFDGTIAENIARLNANPDSEKIVAAAQKAAAHEMILKFPDGYDTRVSSTGGLLSGGQLQRIGLARALYGEPVILVLDEPNSNLDNEGGEALNQAIRSMKAEGKSVIIMAHRPSAIKECDTLLMLENGTAMAFGPKDDVLRGMVKNHEAIQKASMGGVS